MNIKVCLHWTGGRVDKANGRELKSYHFIVLGDGTVVEGKYKPENNFKKLTNRDVYAAHCGGGNSFTIGVALAGGPRNYKLGGIPHEITRASYEKACELIANLCIKYGINTVVPANVYTHYEFGQRNKGTDSFDKTDVTSFPWLDLHIEKDYSEQRYGNEFRTTVNWYINKIRKG